MSKSSDTSALPDMRQELAKLKEGVPVILRGQIGPVLTFCAGLIGELEAQRARLREIERAIKL